MLSQRNGATVARRASLSVNELPENYQVCSGREPTRHDANCTRLICRILIKGRIGDRHCIVHAATIHGATVGSNIIDGLTYWEMVTVERL